MAAKGGLYGCQDPACWRRVRDLHWAVVEAKGSERKGLAGLEKWYQEELPAALAGRKEKHLTQGEVVKLMQWKLTRGKFRPRLQQLVATNSQETVERCTRKAFQLLPDVAAAITELSQLKAIGPATASAILAAGAPEVVAFMADEAVESIPGLTPIKYSLKHYICYLDRIQLCTKKLNEVDKEKDWTPHQVEMCLWAWAVAQKLCPALLQTLCLGEEEAGEDARATKKQKTK
ncbi:uncharacterized protein LOC106737444 isoform X2 [Alligator mississippiensis]|uniref:Uncharacterized protein n=1 Tax=Alligator mississippiensis TaxID=8496 RepID=A0A151N6W0_ALLMI|nr:uncharacterized protein LOC106737444 isoform X2 [Alligator mississippiensis]KYO32487.1 hypothetical protein Y1Q_0020419 [Alligator mississippiensis]